MCPSWSEAGVDALRLLSMFSLRKVSEMEAVSWKAEVGVDALECGRSVA